MPTAVQSNRASSFHAPEFGVVSFSVLMQQALVISSLFLNPGPGLVYYEYQLQLPLHYVCSLYGTVDCRSAGILSPHKATPQDSSSRKHLHGAAARCRGYGVGLFVAPEVIP